MKAAYLKELLALMLIGEGVVGSLYPERYVRTWDGGAPWWRGFIDWWARRPGLMRAVCLAETGAGLWLATRQFPPPAPARKPGERRADAGRATGQPRPTPRA